jgi:peptide/nickel transport system substrate-binding protein
MSRPLRLAAVCGAVAVVIVSGCGRSRHVAAGNATVRIAAAFPTLTSPDLGLSALVNGLAKDALLAYSPDGHILANLAESWNWDETRTRVRLRIRDNVLFHNGYPLTADLVAKSLKLSVAAGPYTSFTGVESVSAVDNSTLEIRLHQPDVFLLPDLASVPIEFPGNRQIGAGPFRIAERSGNRTTLRAFDKYYRGSPAISAIEIQVYPTQRNAWAAMLRGDADMLHEVSRDAVDFVEEETRVKTFTFPRAYYVVLAFNVRNPQLKDPAVRRAINLAIDRRLIVSEGLRGRGKPADGPVWPEHWAYTAPRHPFVYDPDAARSQLEAAHFPVRTDAAGSMPKRFSFRCMVWSEDSRFDRTALLLQKELYDIGIDMRLEPVSLSDMGTRSATGDFDAFLFEMVSGKDLGWVYAFWHSPTGKALIDTGYRGADAILDNMRRATSDEDLRKETAALDDLLTVDPPAAFIAWQAQSRAVSKRVLVPADPNRDILASARLWRFAATDESKQ